MQPELGARRPRPRLEVVASERDQTIQRSRVAVARVGASGESQRRRFQLALGVRDPGAPSEEREDGLSRLERALLVEIPHGERLRRARDEADVRRLEPRDDPKQGRLARPVRAEEPESGARADREIDPLENGLGAVALADADESYPHRRTSEDRGRARVVAREERNGVG